MSLHNVVFSLNDREKLIIELADPLEDVHCTYEHGMLVFLQDQEKRLPFYELNKETITYFVHYLKARLLNALNNRLHLQDAFKHMDIGFLCNEYNDYAFINRLEDAPIWEWERYKFTMNDHWASWIYNDTDGAIIFTITPIYPYESYSSYTYTQECEQDPGYMVYEEWIKHYKPYVIRTLSVDVAQEWVMQLDGIIQRLDAQ